MAIKKYMYISTNIYKVMIINRIIKKTTKTNCDIYRSSTLELGKY